MNDFLKKLYIQIKNLYGHLKLGELQSNLSFKNAASSTGGIAQSSVNYLCERKSEYWHDLLCS